MTGEVFRLERQTDTHKQPHYYLYSYLDLLSILKLKKVICLRGWWEYDRKFESIYWQIIETN